MTDDLLNTILKVLRGRDIPYDRDALKSALADPESQTAIQEWVTECLSPETLLTKDEATLYTSLVKSGEYDLLSKQDTPALSSTEINTAIDSLRHSTAAIEKQTEALKLQQSALNTLLSQERKTKQVRAQIEREQIRKWDAEDTQIESAVKELEQSLRFQVLDAEQGLKAQEISINSAVEGLLREDDRLLGSLVKLGGDLDPVSEPEGEGVIANIRGLCARLIKHTVEGIRTRLDRIYLEALENAPRTDEGEDASDLQDELESLYTEILPVAQMSTEQQYLEPALRALASTSGQGQERTAKAIEYTQESLVFLINRVETFLERAEEAQAHKMAMESVLETAKAELSRTDHVPRAASPTKANSQRQRKGSAASAKSFGKVQRRRSSGQGVEDEEEPEHQLARNLGLTLPPPTDSSQNTIQALEKALSERKTRVEIHANALQSTTESQISSYLSDAYRTLDLLKEALLVDTRYKKVDLVDPELQDLVDHLDRDVVDVQAKLERVSLHTLQARNVRRDGFVERWSR